MLGGGCLQLSALDILTCRAVGPVDGPLSAAVDEAAAEALLAHSTVVGLVRSSATLAVVFDVGGLLRPSVFFKLVAAGSSCLLGAAALLMHRLMMRHAKAAARTEAAAPGAGEEGAGPGASPRALLLPLLGASPGARGRRGEGAGDADGAGDIAVLRAAAARLRARYTARAGYTASEGDGEPEAAAAAELRAVAEELMGVAAAAAARVPYVVALH